MPRDDGTGGVATGKTAQGIATSRRRSRRCPPRRPTSRPERPLRELRLARGHRGAGAVRRRDRKDRSGDCDYARQSGLIARIRLIQRRDRKDRSGNCDFSRLCYQITGTFFVRRDRKDRSGNCDFLRLGGLILRDLSRPERPLRGLRLLHPGGRLELGLGGRDRKDRSGNCDFLNRMPRDDGTGGVATGKTAQGIATSRRRSRRCPPRRPTSRPERPLRELRLARGHRGAGAVRRRDRKDRSGDCDYARQSGLIARIRLIQRRDRKDRSGDCDAEPRRPLRKPVPRESRPERPLRGLRLLAFAMSYYLTGRGCDRKDRSGDCDFSRRPCPGWPPA